MNDENVVHPIQPSFALGASYYYKKVMVDSPFSHFYQFQHKGEDEPLKIVPDATMDIIFECGSRGSVANVYGQVLSNWQIALKKNMTYFGVRFLPGYIPEAWRGAYPNLVQGIMPIEMLGLNHPAYSSFTAEMDFNRKIETFIDVFSENRTDYPGRGLFAYLVRQIFDSGGNITVEKLEKDTGYSRRYIHKVFQKKIGIAPKTFCMIIKFQKTIQALNRGEYVSLSEVASVMGYYDQSQFIDDFKRSTALTPKQYERLIRERKYNSLISQF